MHSLSLCLALLLSFLSFVAGDATSTEANAAVGTIAANQIPGSMSTDVSALATQTPSIVTAPASQNVPSSVLALESSIFTSPSTTPRPLPATASAAASSSVSSIASSTLSQASETSTTSPQPTNASSGPTLNTTIIVIIAVAGGAVLLLTAGITIFCCIRRRNRNREQEQRSGSTLPGSRARDYVDLEKTGGRAHRARGAPQYRGVEKLEPLKTDFGTHSADDAFSSPVKPTAPRPVVEVRQVDPSPRTKRARANTNKDLPAGPAPSADPYNLGPSLDDDAEGSLLGLSPESPLSLLANGRFSQVRSGTSRPPMPTIPAGAQPAAQPTGQPSGQQSSLNVPAPARAYSPSLYSARDSVTPAGRTPSTHIVVPEQEASRFSFGFGGGAPPPASTGPVMPTMANLAAATRGSTLGVPPNQRPGSRRSVNSGGSGSVFESAPWPPTSWGGAGPRYVNGRWA